MFGATCPSGSHLLRVEEYVPKALQAGHADLRAGVLEALSQYSQGSLFRKHLQQGRAIEELGAPESKVASGSAFSWLAYIFVGGSEPVQGLGGRMIG